MSNYIGDEVRLYPVGLLNSSRIYNKNYSNLFNICYINASIQCLFRLDEFVKNILKCYKGDLTLATKKLINLICIYNFKFIITK